MADDVTIRFIADISNLQKGMQQAAGAVDATVGTLRSGASQAQASFASLSQAVAGGGVQMASDDESNSEALLANARRVQQARYESALEGLQQQSAITIESGRLGQMSRQAELAGLLALDQEKEDLDRRRLEAARFSGQEKANEFAENQRAIVDLSSRSALSQLDIMRRVNGEIAGDYRRSFEQIGASASTSIMGMIQGQQTLAQAAQKVCLAIIQSFLQAKIKMVGDWTAGAVAQLSVTASSEASKTAAVAAGTSARTSLEATASTASAAETISAVLRSISASAAETFAGIFGFLAPVMGPGAAGPAAAGAATVASAAGGLASFAVGAWSLPSDMIAAVHQGEMIVPAGPAAALRSALEGGGGAAGAVHVHNSTNFNIQAVDAMGLKQFFKDHGKTILRSINESVRTGSHLGLTKLGTV
ncbi:hypothetical protein [Methylocapsa acidiphila]|uniref:hypothetical protein n=1 Tax=Methylocapsa acidiphila TaxID=133552 RepID=UPI0004024B32|nr:hypothetical protein [Methylocapsa acidiphila]